MFRDLPGQLYTSLIANDRWMLYLEGLGRTIVMGAVLVGLFLGTLVAVIKVNKVYAKKPGILLKIGDWLCDFYLTVIRGTPAVIQLLIAVNVIFAAAPISSSLYVAIVAFGVNSGAYVAEIIRAGIMAVDRGQMEAGRSLGLSNGMTMQKIILPQAVKNILPAMGNEFITLIKETAVVGYVAVEDLTKMAELIQSRTYQPLVPLLLSALIYLALVMLLSAALKKLERRLARSDNR